MLYNLGIYLFGIVLRILAPFDLKIKKGCAGRSETFDILEKNLSKEDKNFWFHCASLGEYEQGLPVFQKLKQKYPQYKIILTFFSPSGYEVRKNSDLADVVIYLPLDTKRNAEIFLSMVNPVLTIFVKYEIWPNYLIELKKRNLEAILISGLFRKEQAYFKWYGTRLREALRTFDHIFVQDLNSKDLLKDIDIQNVTFSGDTRYDRVFDQLKKDNHLPWLERFKGRNKLIVFGSTWPEDEELIIKYINENQQKGLKFLIAPHEIKETHIKVISNDLNAKFVKYSNIEHENIEDATVLILDTVGLLTKVYSYADISYVGGAMGNTGLHNILEPAAFAIPIIIGPNHHKFPEALEIKDLGGLISINDYEELTMILNKLVADDNYAREVGEINGEFVNDKKGAVIQIMDYIRI